MPIANDKRRRPERTEAIRKDKTNEQDSNPRLVWKIAFAVRSARTVAGPRKLRGWHLQVTPEDAR